MIYAAMTATVAIGKILASLTPEQLEAVFTAMLSALIEEVEG